MHLVTFVPDLAAVTIESRHKAISSLLFIITCKNLTETLLYTANYISTEKMSMQTHHIRKSFLCVAA